MSHHPGLVQLGQRPLLKRYLRDIWARRELALTLPLGELRAQNMNTVLGGAWHLLNPLLLVAVYYVVFGVILGVGDRGTDNFIAFLAIGIFAFFYTRKSVQAGSKAIISNMQLIRSIKFPRAILPIAAVVGEAIALGPAVIAMLSVALLTGESVHASWLLILPIFALQTVLNLGLAFFVARVTDHFRDTDRFLPYVLQLWFYLSGVLYAVDHFVGEGLVRQLFVYNPAYAFITLAREAVLDGTTTLHLWGVAGGWSVSLLIIGFFFFRAREESYGRG